MATKVSKSLITSVDVSQINTTGSDAGKVLTSNGSTLNWVASSNIAPTDVYTSAVCYIPSSPGTGSWTAPAGITSARVTIVGGGGGGSLGIITGITAGGRSHFNYATGTTPSTSQLYANGGGAATSIASGTGGASGWLNLQSTTSTTRAEASTLGVGGRGTDGGNSNPGVLSIYGYPLFYMQDPVSFVTPRFSLAALSLANFTTAFSQASGIGRGGYGSNSNNPNRGGGGGSWCSVVVSVTPEASYSYGVGAAGVNGATPSGGVNTQIQPCHGMVLIEW